MASSSTIHGKITLHSTSKIPLSERFKMVQQTALIKKNMEPVARRPKVNPGPQRSSVKPSFQGSRKNRLLAASMAQKPSVLAALKIKKKSIKQRLGAKQSRIGSTALVNRSFSGSRKSNKRSLSDRLQIAPKPGTNVRRPKLNRNNFIGTTQVSPKNVRRVNRRQGGVISSSDNLKRRPLNSRFNSNNNVANKKNQPNRPQRQRNNNAVVRKGQRVNQHMKNRKLATNNFKGNQRNPQLNQRQFNRRNNQVKPGQGMRSRGGFNQEQRNVNVKKRFQNRKPNRQNQRRRNPDKNTLDKDLDAYMAKTRTQPDRKSVA